MVRKSYYYKSILDSLSAFKDNPKEKLLKKIY